ncbi:MAG: hypothetical protein ACHQE5_04410 [Actinomycetes bacterium]
MTTQVVRDIDAALDRLRSAVQSSAEVARDLENDLTRRLVLAARTTGATADAVAATEADLRFIWAGHLALVDRLALAENLRGVRSRPPRRHRDAARSLLGDRTVQVAAVRPDGSGRRRGGHDEQADRYTVDELLLAMDAACRRIAALLARIDHVWSDTVAALTTAHEEVTAAVGGMRAVCLPVPNTAARSERVLDELLRTARTDPLDVDDDLLRVTVNRARSCASSLREALLVRASFEEDVVEATAAVADAEREVALTESAWSRGRVSPGAGHLQTIDTLARQAVELRQSLTSLLGVADVDWAATARRLADLNRRADRLSALAQRTAQAQRDAVTQRDLLRGRLAAFRTKAAALGRSENTELDLHHGAARDELYCAPCRLDLAEALVATYVRLVEEQGRP